MSRTASLLVVVAAVLVGGGGSAYLALRVLGKPAGDPAPATSPTTLHSGYYLETLHKSGARIDDMTPLLLSPLEDEHVSPQCPERLVVHPDGTHERRVRPYLDAIGRLGLEPGGDKGLVGAVVENLDEYWQTLRIQATGPPTQPPLRILVKHYPRPELKGHCVTIHATFYNTIDVYLDRIDLTALMNPGTATHVRGVIIDLRRTYQLDGQRPRLIEAIAEIHRNIAVAPPRETVWQLASVPTPLAEDRHFGSHFQAFGGGERLGWAWGDNSLGLGPTEPVALAYRINRQEIQGQPQVTKKPLGPEAVDSLIALVERA